MFSTPHLVKALLIGGFLSLVCGGAFLFLGVLSLQRHVLWTMAMPPKMLPTMPPKILLTMPPKMPPNILPTVPPKVSPKICLSSAFNLRFEHRRILDWISYHHLIGIECFFLMHANPSEDIDSPASRHVNQMLLSASPMVKIVSIDFREKMAPTNLAKLARFVEEQGAQYLAMFDVDEFLVSDKAAGGQGWSRGHAPDLRKYLDDIVGQHSAAGMYIYRWDYGPGVWHDPPELLGKPEFTFFRWRQGGYNRDKPEHADDVNDDIIGWSALKGKLIWNSAAFGTANETVQVFCSEHGWRMGSAMESKRVMLSDGSAVTTTGFHVGIQHGKCVMPRVKSWSRQPWSINHYVTGSRSECQLKLKMGKHFRKRSKACNERHPVKDIIMLPRANFTVTRRRALFPDYNSSLF